MTLSYVIDRYLSWVEGYENLWDEERKAREDEQTNFGPLLQEMNQKLRVLVDSIFEPNYKHRRKNWMSLILPMSAREWKEKRRTTKRRMPFPI